jgi:ferredoxin-NADP reductase
LVRQYSLTGIPSRDHWTVAVLREEPGRGGSDFVHRTLTAGASLDVSEPRNHFRFHGDAPVIFIAGGIGITPLRAMICEAQQRGLDWKLLYGGRTRKSMAYADELTELGGDRVLLWPQETHGLLPLHDELMSLPPGQQVYACGPEPLLTAIEELMKDRADCLHVERFTAPSDLDRTDDQPFAVELVQTKRRLHIAPGESILARVTDLGVFAPSSCREGTCGACETVVLDGEPDHRDSVLTAAERSTGETMMICVSRAKSSLIVLDL